MFYGRSFHLGGSTEEGRADPMRDFKKVIRQVTLKSSLTSDRSRGCQNHGPNPGSTAMCSGGGRGGGGGGSGGGVGLWI